MTNEGSGVPESAQALPGQLDQHVEWLAARVHDAWTQERLAGGWRYGASRNDSRREHPSLVSFAELSEDEREMDRVVVIATLKGLLDLGYSLERPTR